MKKIYLLFMMLIIPWVNYGQISYSYGWEPTGLGGWVNSGEGSMLRTTINPCMGDASVRVNFYDDYYDWVSDNIFRSPLLGVSNQGLVTVNLNYKVVNYFSSATPASYFRIKWQWSNSTSGPWIDFYEINATNHVASTNCSVATATFSPGAGDVYIRFSSDDLSDGVGDYLIYYDEINVTQGPTPSCFMPLDVNVSNVNSNGAVINWSAPEIAPSQGYFYEVRTDTNPGQAGAVSSGAVPAGTTVNTSGLQANTVYNVFVKSVCNGDSASLWSVVKTFRTTCAAVSTLPYLENFDTYGTGANAFPFCWFRPVVNAGYPSIVAANPSSTPNSLRFQSQVETPTYAITPAFSQDIQSLRVKFKLKREGLSSGVMELGVMTDPSDLSTFELVRVINPIGYDLTEYITDLNATTLTGTNRYIALRHISDAGNWYYWLDDFEVTLSPSCLAPLNINTNSITNNSATISWNASFSVPANGYEYEIRTTGTPGSGTTGLTDSGTVAAGILTKNVNSLVGNTSYSVYVRAICSSTDQSEWSVVKTFKTLCDVTTIPYLVAMPASGIPECFTLENVNADTILWTSAAAQTGITGRVMSLSASSTLASNDWFYLQGLQMTAGQAYRLSFKHKKGTASANQKLKVAFGLSPVNSLMTNQIGEVVFSNSTDAQSQYFDFIPTTTGIYFIGFHGYAEASQGTLYVGEIKVENSPSCIGATNVNVSAITNNNATISWSASYSVPANGYEYEIRTSGLAGSGPTGLTDSGTVTAGVLTKDISSLVGNTSYSIYVRAICSSTDQSEWSVVKTFKTLCDVTTIPYLVAMPTTGVPDCFILQNVNADAISWSSAAAQTGITGRVMSLSTSSTLVSDDWFYLQGLQMTAGQAYRLRFKFKKGTASANQKLKVAYGLSTINTAMTNQIGDVVFSNTADAQSQYFDFIPTTTGVYFIGFHGYAEPSQGTLYVGEIKVENSPSCMEPLNVQVTDVTKNSVKLNWGHPTTIPSSGYAYEVRTSGAGGSGTTGLFQTGIASVTEIQKVISSLDPSTTYTLYLSSVCGVDSNSIWVNGGTITTLCNYPDLVSITPATRCGFGTVDLAANFSNNELIRWFSSATGGSLLHLGANFVTPMLDETTSYFVESGNPIPNSAIQAGSGTATSSTYSNPFYSNWSNSHTQFIITASELSGYGLAPGPITSVALNVTSAGTIPMKDLSIKIGNTTRNNLDDFDVTAVLNTVYTNSSYLPVTGSNTFQFSTPFVWDGVSNIVIEFCHGNSSSSATMSRTIRMVSTDYNSAIKSHVGAATSASTICSDVTSNKEAYKLRPQFLFAGVGLCPSPRVEVVATVTPPPALTLSSSQVEICEGTSQLVSLITGLTDYSDFTWSPNTGFTGNAQDGWVFNPSVSTVYTLTASQNSGVGCVNLTTVDIIVNERPQLYEPIDNEYLFCIDTVHELDSGIQKNDVTFIDETFTGSTSFPTNWYREVGSGDQVAIVNENTAGGQANQLKITGNSNSDILDRAYFGPINTSGLEAVTLQWKSFLNHYSNSYAYSVKIQTSVDGQNWVNTSWNYSPVTAVQPASVQTLVIDNENVGSTTFYVSFTVEGKTFGMHNWNIDDVKLTGMISPEVVWSPVDNLYIDEAATQPYLSGYHSDKVYFKSNETVINKIYSIVATNPNSCTLTQTTTVSVIDVAEPIVAEQHFCTTTLVEDIVVTGLQTGGTLKWFASEEATQHLTEITTTGTYYVEQQFEECKSDRVEVVIHIDTITTAPVGDSVQIICDSGTVADLQATPSTGNTIHWFDSENGVTPLALTEELVSGVYYVAQYNEFCWSPRLEVSVQINPTPIAPNSVDQEFCGIHTLSEVNLGQAANATLKWYSNATSSEALPLTQVMQTGTYYATQTILGCESERTPVEIVVLEALLAPVAPAVQLYCGSVTFAGLDVTPDPTGVIGWFNSQTASVPISQGLNVTSGTYYVAQYNGICWSPKTQVAITVNPVPSVPPVSNKELCGVYTFGEINFNIANNATLNWYSSLTSTDVLSLTDNATSGNYFVSQTIGGCESSRVQVSLLIVDYLPVPVAPATQFYCGTITFSGLDATANSNGTIGWFASSSATTPISMTQIVTSGTYYVAQFNGVCWSEKAQIQITSNPIPVAPNNTAMFLCGPHTLSMVNLGQANNATLKWYATENSNTILAMSTVVTNGVYYVSQTIGGCESPRVAIQLTVTEILAMPVAVSQTFCGSGTVADLVAQGVEGASFKWYSSNTSTIALSPNVPLVTGTYYVEQTKNTCASPRKAVAVHVVSITAPVINHAGFNFCGSATVADLYIPAASGVTFKWFTSPSSLTELTQNTALNTGSYYVSRIQNGCESQRAAVVVTIHTIPNAPTGAATQTFVEGTTISELVMNQTNVVWYSTYNDSQTGTNALSSNMPMVNGATYYGVIIGTNGCPSLPFAVTVTVTLSTNEFVKNELKYYPNPVVDKLNVSYSERITQVEVFDLLGKKVKSQNTDDTNIDIDLSDLSTGTYMIQLKTENKQQFIKVIKN